MAEPSISYRRVCKAYGGEAVLEDFTLDVAQGEFLTVIGRSGCGKTTVLKLTNGLITPDSGQVLVNGADVSLTDPVALRRSIGYAIQNVGLFPHMTVEKNIAYVPSISGDKAWSGQAVHGRAAALLELVGLEPSLGPRYPRSLSGGQRQRVGIARALAAEPGILLMDEPFAAVDEMTRQQLQDQILRIHRQKGMTVLFVTHDIREALRLGTRVLVMEQGRVQQCAAPSSILEAPATPFVAQLVSRARQ